MLFLKKLIYYIMIKGDENLDEPSLLIKILMILVEFGLISSLIFKNKVLNISLGLTLFFFGLVVLS